MGVRNDTNIMKWSKGRKKEKETLLYFMSSHWDVSKISDEDWYSFFSISERGVYPSKTTYGLDALLNAKQWRGRHCNTIWDENDKLVTRCMYEEGILEGTMPYRTILGGEDGDTPVPRSVMEYMKNSLFGGIDSEKIEMLYDSILLDKKYETL